MNKYGHESGTYDCHITVPYRQITFQRKDFPNLSIFPTYLTHFDTKYCCQANTIHYHHGNITIRQYINFKLAMFCLTSNI